MRLSLTGTKAGLMDAASLLAACTGSALFLGKRRRIVANK
jgi:hypothetical protein